MVRHVAAYRKALQLENRYMKGKWDELKSLLKESGYRVKTESKNELYLDLKNDHDIELFFIKNSPLGDFVHIQLWGPTFTMEKVNEKHYKKSHRYSTLMGAVNYINVIYEDMRLCETVENP